MKKTAILAFILIAILSCTMVACNKNGEVQPNSIQASFELSEDDGLNNFSLRRGIVFAHKISELKRIDGIEADWSAANDGSVQITVKNIGSNLSAVLAAIGSMPELEFKLENSASAPAVFKGKDNVKSISVSQGSLTNPTIQIELTAKGIDTISNYLNKQLYLFVGNEFCISAKSETLTNGNMLYISTNSELIAAETLAAKLNVGAFGLGIKNMSIQYAG